MKFVLLLVLSTIAASSARFLSYNEKKEVFNLFDSMRRGEHLEKKAYKKFKPLKARPGPDRIPVEHDPVTIKIYFSDMTTPRPKIVPVEHEPQTKKIYFSDMTTPRPKEKVTGPFKPNVVNALPEMSLPPQIKLEPITFAPPEGLTPEKPKVFKPEPITFAPPEGLTPEKPKLIDLGPDMKPNVVNALPELSLEPITFAPPEGFTPEKPKLISLPPDMTPPPAVKLGKPEIKLPPAIELEQLTLPPEIKLEPQSFTRGPPVEIKPQKVFTLPPALKMHTEILPQATLVDDYMEKRGLVEQKKDNFEEKVLSKLNNINDGVEGLMVAPLMNQIIDTLDNLGGICDHTMMFLYAYLNEWNDDESPEASTAQPQSVEEEDEDEDEDEGESEETSIEQPAKNETAPVQPAKNETAPVQPAKNETASDQSAEEDQETSEKRELLKRLLTILKEQSAKKRSSRRRGVRTKRNAWWAVDWDLIVDVCRTYYQTSSGFSY